MRRWARYRLRLVKCWWQGKRATWRGDYDLGVNGPHGRMTLTKREAEGLREALAQEGIETPGCDCGHDGAGRAWHDKSCTWWQNNRQ